MTFRSTLSGTASADAEVKITHVQQLHMPPGTEDIPASFKERIAQSQYWVARAILANPSAIVLAEGVNENLTPENRSFAWTLVAQMYFPDGIPSTFSSLTTLQKKMLSEHCAAFVLFYLGKITHLYKTSNEAESKSLEPILAKALTVGLSKTEEATVNEIREDRAIFWAKDAALTSGNNKVLLVYGGAHDFEYRIQQSKLPGVIFHGAIDTFNASEEKGISLRSSSDTLSLRISFSLFLAELEKKPSLSFSKKCQDSNQFFRVDLGGECFNQPSLVDSGGDSKQTQQQPLPPKSTLQASSNARADIPAELAYALEVSSISQFIEKGFVTLDQLILFQNTQPWVIYALRLRNFIDAINAKIITIAQISRLTKQQVESLRCEYRENGQGLKRKIIEYLAEKPTVSQSSIFQSAGGDSKQIQQSPLPSSTLQTPSNTGSDIPAELKQAIEKHGLNTFIENGSISKEQLITFHKNTPWVITALCSVNFIAAIKNNFITVEQISRLTDVQVKFLMREENGEILQKKMAKYLAGTPTVTQLWRSPPTNGGDSNQEQALSSLIGVGRYPQSMM